MDSRIQHAIEAPLSQVTAYPQVFRDIEMQKHWYFSVLPSRFAPLLSANHAVTLFLTLQEFKATLAGLKTALDTASSQSSGPYSLTGTAYASCDP